MRGGSLLINEDEYLRCSGAPARDEQPDRRNGPSCGFPPRAPRPLETAAPVLTDPPRNAGITRTECDVTQVDRDKAERCPSRAEVTRAATWRAGSGAGERAERETRQAANGQWLPARRRSPAGPSSGRAARAGRAAPADDAGLARWAGAPTDPIVALAEDGLSVAFVRAGPGRARERRWDGLVLTPGGRDRAMLGRPRLFISFHNDVSGDEETVSAVRKDRRTWIGQKTGRVFNVELKDAEAHA